MTRVLSKKSRSICHGKFLLSASRLKANEASDLIPQSAADATSYLSHLFESLFQVGDDVFDILDTDAEANQVRSDACFDELFIAQLTVRVASRVQHAAAGIGHMSHDANHLEAIHELDALVATTLDAERKHAARKATLKLFLGQGVVLVVFEAGVIDPGDLRVLLEPLGASKSVFAMARHAEVERFEAEVQKERILRALDATEVAHQLHGRLRDVAFLAEGLRIS